MSESKNAVAAAFAPRPKSAVFVDAPFFFKSRHGLARKAGQTQGHRWCHMWSADIQALHAIANQLGMEREWFQNRPGFPHYDLLPHRREAALKLGAIECSLREWLRTQRRKTKFKPEP